MSPRAGGVPRGTDPLVARLLQNCVFPERGTEVTCAVSGGADSSALLALAVAAGLEVTAVHVDHGLRQGSDRDGPAVAELAAAWGAAVRLVRVDVAEGSSVEARARRARRAVMPPGTMYGHTADDLAETVLMRMLRGTGPAGLASMDPATHPMLGLRRSQTVALCEHLGVTALVDPTNSSPAFTRNRIRREVLPLLDEVSGRDVVPLICRLASLAGEEAVVIDELASRIDPTDANELRDVPRPLAGSAVRQWWLRVTGLEYPPDHDATERILLVARGDSRACDVVSGWRVSRTGGRLRLVPPGEPGLDRTSRSSGPVVPPSSGLTSMSDD